MNNGIAHFFYGAGRLAGFAAVSQSGFALPLYMSGLGGNSLYTARTEVPGDPESPIAEFEAYWQTDPPIQLLGEHGPNVEIGSLAVQVFLWEGEAYFGSLAEIRDQLKNRISDVQSKSPVAFLGIMGDEEDSNFPKNLNASSVVLGRRFGVQAMREWALGSYFASRAKTVLRREARIANWNGELVAAIDKVRTTWDGELVRLHSPMALHEKLNGTGAHAASLVRVLFDSFDSLCPGADLAFLPDRKLGR